MAYNPKNLSALTYANGFTLWHYKTPDDSETVDTAGYFNLAANMLRVGDFVFTNVDADGAVASGVMIVASNSGGIVDMANANSFGTVNSR